jgi:uncharacterized protein (TIGR02172 family)
MKGELIGEGNTAEVYAWGEKEILKLFRQNFYIEGIEREYRTSKEIERLGIPVPKAGIMIELEGRNGITYERIIGSSMLSQIMKKPFTGGKFAKDLAELHYQIHKCKGEGLPNYKEVLEWNIRHAELLTDIEKFAILNQLEQLPEGEALCHGDFHPGNIMTKEEKSYVLDWMTAAVGNPCADVARTVLLIKDAALPEGMPRMVGYIIERVRRRLAKIYLKKYLHLSGIKLEEINRWRVPIMAARLLEWVPEAEKNNLLKEIKQALNEKHNKGK